MTITETLAPRRRHTMPYPDRATLSAVEWDSRIDTLPLLRTTDIRTLERLRAIRDCARRGIAEIDAALTSGQNGTR